MTFPFLVSGILDSPQRPPEVLRSFRKCLWTPGFRFSSREVLV